MSKRERKSGRGSGPVTIGAISVSCRWHFSYLEGSESEEDFKFVASLTLGERKKLVNLKKGDWTTLTAGPFTEIPVYLSDIEYKGSSPSVIFTKARSILETDTAVP
jgi:hypothetical protein